jgi:predicted nuclease of predicted toxin-antitoxin system
MKLILDAQLPILLCDVLDQLDIESMHVIDLPNGDETSDTEITKYADENDLVVVTKDVDFYHSFMNGRKPKRLFLITTGNIKNRELCDLFRKNQSIIQDALFRSDFIEMNTEGITEY